MLLLYECVDVYNTVCGGRSYPASTSTFLSTAADTIQVMTNPVFVIYCSMILYIFIEPLNESSMIYIGVRSLKSNGQF